MRSLWKGAISFGLVNIPVQMYAATEEKSVKFRQLHQVCNTPLQYQKSCPHCQREVPAEEIIRGYEYAPGQFVVLTEADLDNLPGEATKTIDIIDFVNLQEIDPVYYHKTYYLAPQPTGQKAYALLRLAMTETNRIAIAKVVLRAKPSLCAIRVQNSALVLRPCFSPMNRPQINWKSPEVALNPKEVDMAISLIGSLTDTFAPENTPMITG